MDDIWLEFIYLWWYRLWPASGYNRAGPRVAAPARRGPLLRATSRGHWRRHLTLNDSWYFLTFDISWNFIFPLIFHMMNWWRTHEKLMKKSRAEEELMKAWWRVDEELMKNWWRVNRELTYPNLLVRPFWWRWKKKHCQRQNGPRV